MRLLLKIIVLAVFAVAAALAWDSYQFFSSPINDSQSQILQVAPGSGFRSISNKLLQEGIFKAPRHAQYFSGYARLRGVTQKVHTGEYEIEPGLTPLGLLQAMVAGRTLQYRLTIVEGWNFSELRAVMEKHEALEQTLRGKSDKQVMAALGQPDGMPEGLFLPDTYKFPRGTTDVAFLNRAYKAMQKALAEEWETREKDLPIDSAYEALIMASIVEKETAVPEERNRIAGVFLRRLKIGMPLQTDPTVIYGVPNFDGNLRRRDLTRDTPYNTYTRRGLPPTPIALPGRAAINATLHPAEGKALYFVSKGDGSHVFSPTLKEHNQAVRKYQLNLN